MNGDIFLIKKVTRDVEFNIQNLIELVNATAAICNFILVGAFVPYQSGSGI